MESRQVRDLILGHDWRKANQALSVDYICKEIANAARKAGVLGDDVFDQRTQVVTTTGTNRLEPFVTDEAWQLVLEGVFAPGKQVGYRLTPHGAKVIAEKQVTPHDYDGYLQRITSHSPSIDLTTQMYLSESLRTYRTCNYLASTVMLGVASESVLLKVVDAMCGALDSQAKIDTFKKATTGKFASTQHAEVWSRLRSHIALLPDPLKDVVEPHLSGMFNLIRESRNDAGHPKGRKMERDETYGLLMMFQPYCKTAYALIDWFGAHPNSI